MKPNIFLALCVAASWNFTFAETPDRYELDPAKGISMPLVRLLSNPDQFDGKVVNVSGFVNRTGDIGALYLTKNDWRHGFAANGVILTFRWPDTDPTLTSFRGFFTVQGIFRNRGGLKGTLPDANSTGLLEVSAVQRPVYGKKHALESLLTHVNEIQNRIDDKSKPLSEEDRQLIHGFLFDVRAELRNQLSAGAANVGEEVQKTEDKPAKK
jgi:hypothetical protein